MAFLNDEENYEPDLYTLVDEDGKEQQFEFIDQYEENGVVYYALVPYIEDPDQMLEADADLVVLRLEKDENGEDIMSTIDSEEEYNRIGNIFMERYMEDFDGDDE